MNAQHDHGAAPGLVEQAARQMSVPAALGIARTPEGRQHDLRRPTIMTSTSTSARPLTAPPGGLVMLQHRAGGRCGCILRRSRMSGSTGCDQRRRALASPLAAGPSQRSMKNLLASGYDHGVHRVDRHHCRSSRFRGYFTALVIPLSCADGRRARRYDGLARPACDPGPVMDFPPRAVSVRRSGAVAEVDADTLTVGDAILVNLGGQESR